jgi:hypothetical protein
MNIGMETFNENPVVSKQRHGCVTAWLIMMIIFNSLTAALYLFANEMFVENLPNNPPASMFYLLGVIGFANVFFAIQMMQWKKYAFWGFAITAFGTFSINLSIGLNILQALGGLVGIVILYAVFQIKRDNISAWENLE